MPRQGMLSENRIPNFDCISIVAMQEFCNEVYYAIQAERMQDFEAYVERRDWIVLHYFPHATTSERRRRCFLVLRQIVVYLTYKLRAIRFTSIGANMAAREAIEVCEEVYSQLPEQLRW